MSLHLACLERGSGPRSLVFLHGIGGGKEVWTAQLDHFAAQGWRAAAWDAPGYGDSVPLAKADWPGLAAAVAALIDKLGLERPVVVGHSMGGMLAQEFAARCPDRLRALVLSGTSAAFGRPDGAWQREFLRQRLAPLEAGRSMADLAPGLVAGMVGERPDPAGVAMAERAMAAVPVATYRQALELLVVFDRRAALTELAVPTLLLAGEKDANAPPAVMRRMAERVPGAVYRCLPGAGHLANLEQPQAFNAVLQDFLTRLES